MKCTYAVDGLHGVNGKVGSRIRDVVTLYDIRAAGIVVLDGTAVNTLWTVEKVAELSKSVSRISWSGPDGDCEPAL